MPPSDPGQTPRFFEGELHIWALRVVHSGPEDWALLSEDEREQAARLRFPRDRTRYRAAHAGLRRTLARYLERPPESLAFVPDHNGKPRLGSNALFFNLSHAGDWALVAVTRNGEIGIDLEPEDPTLETDSLAPLFLSEAEQQFLAGLEQSERPRTFLRIWTAKEALTKAYGTGMKTPFPSISLRLSQGGPIHIEAAPMPGPWFVSELAILPGHAAAVAGSGPPPAAVRCYC